MTQETSQQRLEDRSVSHKKKKPLVKSCEMLLLFFKKKKTQKRMLNMRCE